MVSLASEFPNDNPALHRGVIWVCRETTGRAEPERVLAPELMSYVDEPPKADPPLVLAAPEPRIEAPVVETVVETPRAIAPVVTACALLMAVESGAIEANASHDAPTIETIETIESIESIEALASIETIDAEAAPVEALIVEELEPLDEHVAVSVEGALPSLPNAAPADVEIFVDDPIDVAPPVHHADASESVSVPAASDDGADPSDEPVLVAAASVEAVEDVEEHEEVQEHEEAPIESAPAAAVSEIVLVAANENAKRGGEWQRAAAEKWEESLDVVEELTAEPQLASERIAAEILGGSAVLAAAVTPVFEEEIVAAPVPVDSTVLPAATDDPFTILVCTLADVALAAGSPHIAALLPGLLFDGRVSGELDGAALEALRANGVLAGAEIAPDIAAVAGAWREILRGTSDDFSACGAAMLDEWSSDLLARLLDAPAKADAFRQELRSRGVAAFGLAA